MAANARPAPRRTARMTAGGLLVVAATFLPGAQSAADGQRSEAVIDYDCQFPSGSRAVTAVVAAGYPAGGTVGDPVAARDVTVGLDLPRGVLGELEQLDATAVSALAQLAVLYTDATDSAKADWSGLTAPAQDITGRESVTLEAAGPVPTATFGSPGKATLSASDLTLTLSPLKADGSPAEPAAIDVTCRPVPGADTVLASLPISGTPTEEPVEPPPADPDRDDTLPPDQREKLDDARREAGRAQEGSEGDVEPCPFSMSLPTPSEAYVAGFTNVKKLNGAALLGPARTNVTMMMNYTNDPCLKTVRVLSGAEFEHEGKRQLPPSRGTFLSFGFMPTTATMILSQVGPTASIDSLTINDLIVDPRYPEYTTITAKFELRVKDVKVNGVSLDVGPNCRASKPIDQTLKAFGTTYPRSGYTVQYGGTMDGNTYIPAFEGCGVGEDLDPLLTASISGGGNYIKMTQAPLCVSTNPDGPDCPPKVPKPER
ncbi:MULTISPECIES: DUF6801 domain-containing protein [unclassified Streptomyces]|uniref:DUF6801 domain-containing protein n=1 Tax=unclassified Streptomyces TaxID=2593676 RepID=UPI00093D2FF3|nr:DUF6801 domain-containing protein [Streptomyces sp. TSRI0281]OKI46223.1 hypothetical protein A6A29_29160 [Streptomyces sp. TSRI0281]